MIITARCSSFSTVSGARSNLNLRMTCSKPIFISNKARRIPIHWRGPTPNGRNAKGSRFSFASGEKLSGLNSKGLSQKPGSRCKTYDGMLTPQPFGNRMPLMMVSSSHSRNIRNTGPAIRRTSEITWSMYPAFCTNSYKGTSALVSINSSISRMSRSWTSGFVAK